MDVTLSADQEVRLNELASRAGKDPKDLIRDAVDLLLQDARFTEAVEQGFASLDRGDFVSHEEVGHRIEALLKR